MGKGRSHVECDSQWCACLWPRGSQQHPSPHCPAVSHIRNPVASLGNYASQAELRATTTEGSLLGGGLFPRQLRGAPHPQAPFPSCRASTPPRCPCHPLACLPHWLQLGNFLWFKALDTALEEEVSVEASQVAEQITLQVFPSRGDPLDTKNQGKSLFLCLFF